MMLNPICVSQPCSLTERKKSRVGSVVMPYILSSTLRRMSTVSTLSNASSGLSSSSASSDGPSCISSQESVFPPLPLPLVFLSHRLLLCCHHHTSCSVFCFFDPFAQITSCFHDYTSFPFIFLPLFPPPDYSQTVPCCPVPATAGPPCFPARRRTTGSPERTGRSGA